MSTSGTLTALPATAGESELPGWLDRLATYDGVGASEAAMIDQLTQLEALKAAAAAAQARITATYAASRRASARPALQVDADRLARTIGSEVALARRESPARGSRFVGLAQALVRELPHTMAAMTRGELSEWRATLVARETACLSVEDRATVDAELARDLPHLGDRKLADRARALAYELDPGAAVRRSSKAEADRRVSLRPAPDTMVWLGALLPVAQGVAAYAALDAEATSRRAAGDERSRGQLMADMLLERLTGRAAAQPPDVELCLVMPEAGLRDSHQPAHLGGHGPIPAVLARRLVRAADKAWLRRLYTSPETGELVAMDSTRRAFAGRLRDLLVLRDGTCRTPWCDAPIRHVDHVRRAAEGGPTAVANGQGLCEHCNYAKESPGWRAEVVAGGVIDLTTWTGHRYRSGPSPQPGTIPRTPQQRLRRLLDDTG